MTDPRPSMPPVARGESGAGRPSQTAPAPLVAAYRDQRALCRPAPCTYVSPCWVEDGAVAMIRQRCRGCGCTPVLRVW